ncbi:Panacea domain-containing protein [Campylobacter coli]|uniref:Panacea domain-containing protein n=1 Tax=Campylobacter coli TaxID=195 RepID=UPI0040333D1E
MKALDVAKYFLFLARNREAGDTISNLKIQKMLYYAQGYSLALFNKPLFDDRIEAWKHGPVVKKIYEQFKQYGSNSISFDELEDFDTDCIASNKDIHELLIFIFNKYGSIGAWKLRDKTHMEDPWKNSFIESLANEITQDAIADFFKKENKKEALRLKALQKNDEEINSLWR